MELDLDLIKMGFRKVFSSVFLGEPSIYIDRISSEAYEIVVTGKFMGEKNLAQYNFKYPSDWWQAVKERFAPHWFLRRWPVKYTYHEIRVDVIYPELHKRLKMPEEKNNLIVHGYSSKD